MRRLFIISTMLFWLAIGGFWAADLSLTESPDTQAVAAPEKSFTLTEIARHATGKDCWMAIRGQVYDFTAYVPQHPADSSVFVPWCGKEASEAYETKAKGRPHSPYADQLMTRYLLPQGRWGARMGDVTLFDSMLLDGLNDAFSGQHSGWHTEDLVAKCGISREDQDRWALRSQQRFAQAQDAGFFDAEIVPLEVPGRKGPTVFVRDEHNRPDTSAESLARLKPAFRKDGTITAGNAPGLNSGAAALVVAERSWVERNGLTPMARLVSYGVGAVDPGFFGLGPIPAVRKAIARAGWSVSDVDRVEINEAFAAIALACLRELGFAEDVVNAEGGAIAHGHPIGASGAVLTTRLLHQLQRGGGRRGIVTLCIGGGQGIALALELL
ncbi:acetyl-CoA C-acyltransferase [Burkholderia gladioli]|uniref:acetyl-CoA C-acyltransferase n=2 Tax=Burkholderia gladioli TaxID=28095 RepID=UPI00163E26B0|nr:acetyl-CoA C-acyltransferase [Burkholderia gladioli]